MDSDEVHWHEGLFLPPDGRETKNDDTRGVWGSDDGWQLPRQCIIFKKQGSLNGMAYPFFKTVIDVTYYGPSFELTPFAIRVGAIPYAYKWYMSRVTVSRGAMSSTWFDYMMQSLVGQARNYKVGITFEDVTVARSLLSGNLGSNGAVVPQGSFNEDGFNLFTILTELDTENNGNLAVTGCHYKVILTHPENVMMPDE